MGGGGRGMRGNRSSPQPSTSADKEGESTRKAYEISVSLFSNRLGHSIFVVAMSYSGPDTDLALQEFANRLRSSLPSFNCAGWNPNAHINVAHVLALLNQAATESSD